MGELSVYDSPRVRTDFVEYLCTMHGYTMVFGKFKLGSRKKDIGQSQRKGAEHQVQRTSTTIISERNHEIRS